MMVMPRVMMVQIIFQVPPVSEWPDVHIPQSPPITVFVIIVITIIIIVVTIIIVIIIKKLPSENDKYKHVE